MLDELIIRVARQTQPICVEGYPEVLLPDDLKRTSALLLIPQFMKMFPLVTVTGHLTTPLTRLIPPFQRLTVRLISWAIIEPQTQYINSCLSILGNSALVCGLRRVGLNG
jgi:hypothetical protein